LEEALSCIPPPVEYSPDCNKKKTTTKVNGDPPTSVQLWDDFFDKVNQFRFDHQPRFERPKFVVKKIINEEDVRGVLDFNICQTLNDLMGPEYDFSRRPTHTPGIPDFNCHLVKLLILVIEAKRKHVLEDMGEQAFPEFYQASEKARMVIQQIYNYMGENELRYGILATYDNHWFLRREHTKLWISKTLPLQSESPSVLKAYAYLARQAKEDPQSLNPLRVPVPAHGDNNSRVLRSHSKSTSTSSISQQSVSGTLTNQQPSGPYGTSSNAPVDQQNFSFVDFKFKSILGEGRSGKTLLCEFRGNMIALKSVDLSKAPSYVLEEMQKEVEIYKDLADIQGKFIPKLVCYGYYGGGMCFVIGMTIAGTSLDEHKLTKRQRTKALKGLEAIHKHGILHNDIREENILINDNGDVYLIDFGIASRVDTKKKRKLFDEERLKYSDLLDRYIVKKPGRISKSRKYKVVS
jgi:serine/threonine protein kinase